MFRYYYVVIVFLFLKILFWTFFFYLRFRRLRLIDTRRHLTATTALNHADLATIIEYEEQQRQQQQQQQQHLQRMASRTRTPNSTATPTPDSPPPYSEVVNTPPPLYISPAAVDGSQDSSPLSPTDSCKPPAYELVMLQHNQLSVPGTPATPPPPPHSSFHSGGRELSPLSPPPPLPPPHHHHQQHRNQRHHHHHQHHQQQQQQLLLDDSIDIEGQYSGLSSPSLRHLPPPPPYSNSFVEFLQHDVLSNANYFKGKGADTL